MGWRSLAGCEALVIDWLKAANTEAVARVLGLTWDQVDGVMQRTLPRARGTPQKAARVPC